MDENKPILAASSETEKGSSTSAKCDFTNEFSSSFSLYRLQYILEGLQRLLRAGVLTIGRRYDMPEVEYIYLCNIFILWSSVTYCMYNISISVFETLSCYYL